MNDMEYCDLCQGRKTVTLRCFPKLSANYLTADNATINQSHREYPCPECSQLISEDRVFILLSKPVFVPEDMANEEWLNHARRDAAHRVVDELLRKDFFTFHEKIVGHEYDKRREIKMSLGVVSKSRVSSLDERIKENQYEVAEQLARLSAKNIRIWGSHYTGDEGNISKGQAVDSIRDALVELREDNG